MVFSSPLFLFLFLPLTLLIGLSLKNTQVRNVFLLIVSMLFYAWGEGVFLLLMLLSILINYFFAYLIEDTRLITPKRALAWAVVANLALLVFFKYANFIVNNLNYLVVYAGFEKIVMKEIHLPLGISFYTFHSLSYVIDLYRKQTKGEYSDVKKANLHNLALYIMFFPQLVAGPIIRYHDVAQQLLTRATNIDKFASGVRRFVIGLGKKVLLANSMGGIADKIFAIKGDDLTAPLAWLGIVTYSLQIYFDFSGYSDMAIGLGRMFGFEFLENFNYPYIAKSVREFWQRWHISLSRWFRDYLYLPLGGNRVSTGRLYVNLIIVFFCTGFWHGASWNFVVWGLFHGLFMVLERLGLEKLLKRVWSPVAHAYALAVVLVGWVFFRADTFQYSADFLRAMAGFGTGNGILYPLGTFLSNEIIITLTVAIVFSAPVIPYIGKLYERQKLRLEGNLFLSDMYKFSTSGLSIVFLFLVLLASAMSLATGTYNPFIYFRF
ncbi:MBOAT family O-acyltransferase [Candidatus Magnetominusculus xianensis]|uniref:Alginate O-acetyltransferase n=1 Tax=Candidatus Magnetominusculus xianensis TaxID=1748249 RepID=A0ABR5SGK5_9BACT|nr:MBOAT family O-acyltransferase [Candidatus Magnetominusculus xianensis]KWT84404.1 alginate O-acetyltransferase [Candidatus Magnetominusculus xianensis]MBF0404238.1 MBOAT family protein [Nitrospirota bacterium]